MGEAFTSSSRRPATRTITIPLLALVLTLGLATAATADTSLEDTLVVHFHEESPEAIHDVLDENEARIVAELGHQQAIRVSTEDPHELANTLTQSPLVAHVEEETLVEPFNYELQEESLNDGGTNSGGSGDASNSTSPLTPLTTTTVAIIDSGIDATHPDLENRLWEHPDHGTPGYDLVDDDPNPEDRFGHGTHIAGTIATMSPTSELMAFKVMNATGMGTVSAVTEAIHEATHQGADVIVLPIGWAHLPEYPAQNLQDAILEATLSGANVVAAAGNGGPVHQPAALDLVTAVTGLVPSDDAETNAPASWASHGPEVDLAALALHVNSTLSSENTMSWCEEGSQYCTMTGTSNAAAYAAGALAFLRTCLPSLTPAQAHDALLQSATEVTTGDAQPGWDEVTGHGELDLAQAYFDLDACDDARSGTNQAIGTVLWSDDEEAMKTQGAWAVTGERSFTSTDTSYHIGPDADTDRLHTLETSTFYVPEGEDAYLSFARYEDTSASQNHTVRQVHLTWDGGETWTPIYDATTPFPRTWVQEDIPLPEQAHGNPVKAKFVYQSPAEATASFEGWFVDEVYAYVTTDDAPTAPFADLRDTTISPFTGNLAPGECATHAVLLDAPGDILSPGDMRGVDVAVSLNEGDLYPHLRIVSPEGERTGGWACDDPTPRQEINHTSYAGPGEEDTWLRSSPIETTGEWKLIVMLPDTAGEGIGYNLTVTESLVPEEETLPTIAYGDDTFLDAYTLPTEAYSEGCDEEGTECVWDSLGGETFRTTSEIEGTDEAQAELGLGFSYRLEQACQAQAGSAPAHVRPYEEPWLTGSYTGAGAYEATAYVRVDGFEDEPIPVRTMNNQIGFSPEEATFDPRFGSAYEHVISAYTRAEGSTSLDEAKATAEVPKVLWQVVFGEHADVRLDVAHESPDASPVASTADFQGWYREPVTVTVVAYSEDDDARSCLEAITVTDTGDPGDADERIEPGYYQPTTPDQAEANPYQLHFDDDQRYAFEIEARDVNYHRATQTLSFGVDTTPPGTEGWTDLAPEGSDGWFLLNESHEDDGHPTLFIDCEDHGHGSGCTTLHLVHNDASTQEDPDAWSQEGFTVPDGVHTFAYHGEDLVGNEETTQDEVEVKVDTEFPEVRFETSIPSGPASIWYPDDVTVEAWCVDEVSGCQEASVTVDGETHAMDADTKAIAPFNVTGEGHHTGQWTAKDVAGNTPSAAVSFNIDKQNPNATTITAPLDGFTTNQAEATFEWEPAEDPGPAGIHHYRVLVDGDQRTTVKGTNASLALAEGTRCISVKAVDYAGNVGPASEDACILIDRTPPIPWIQGGQHLAQGHDEVLQERSDRFVPNAPGDEAWSLPGVFSVIGHGTDDASGVVEIRILNGTDDADMVTCTASSPAQAMTCSRSFQHALDQAHDVYALTVEAEDEAGNVGTGELTPKHTQRHVYTVYDDDDGWVAIVDYRPIQDADEEMQEDFVEYNIYRSEDPEVWDDPLNDPDHVATITDPDQVRYKEAGLEPETEYYYWIEYRFDDLTALVTDWWKAITGEDPDDDGSSGGGGGGGGTDDPRVYFVQIAQ